MIMSLYMPSSTRTEEIKEDLKALREEVQKYDEAIIGGDLNARNPAWNEANDVTTCVRGKALQNWLDEDIDLQLLSPNENTFRNTSKIDHFIVTSQLARQVANIRTAQEATCHRPVMMDLCLGSRPVHRKVAEKQYKYKEVDWESFRTTMTHQIIQVPIKKDVNYDEVEIDSLILNVTERIPKTMDLTIQKVPIKKSKTSELPDDVTALLKKRRQAVKEKNRARHYPAWRKALSDIIKDNNKKIDQRIREVEEKDLETRLRTIDANHEAFKNIRRITGGNAITCESVEFEHQGKKMASTKEKADCIKEYYEDVYKKVTPPNSRIKEVMDKYYEVRSHTNNLTFEEGEDALGKGEGERTILTTVNK